MDLGEIAIGIGYISKNTLSMEGQFTTFKHFRGGTGLQTESTDDMVVSTQEVKQPVSLPTEIVNMIQERIGGEYKAHFAYRAAANWCKNANYKKASVFFDEGAQEELTHAKDLQDYLTQWNILPEIPPANPHYDFKGLVHIIDEIYDVEYKLLLDYSKNALSVLNSHPATFNFFQKYIDIQNKSVGEFSDLLNALCLININNKLDLLVFEERYF